MTIQLNINVSGESAGEVRNELQALLNGLTAYRGEPIAGEQTGASGGTTEPPRMTAAQKKAAEKAAKEAAEAAAAEAAKQPATAEDKQDAADEAADTAAQKAADPVKLTHDDVKKVLGAHVQAYGMAASQADVKLLLNDAEKLSAIPDTQQALAAAILSIANAIEKNPRKHEIAGDGLEADTIKAITPIVQAARAVK
jgi:hypothetical protein